MNQELSDVYVNPQGKLYRDNKYQNVCYPLDGIREFILTDSALKYHQENNLGLLVLDSNGDLTDRKLDFFTE
jgi:hypothetical protein